MCDGFLTNAIQSVLKFLIPKPTSKTEEINQINSGDGGDGGTAIKTNGFDVKIINNGTIRGGDGGVAGEGGKAGRGGDAIGK